MGKYQREVAAAIANLQTNQIANKLGSTTHLSVIDSEGNAASVTTSNGEGSSHVIPGTGIMVNNMLGEEDLNPAGFNNWPTIRDFIIDIVGELQIGQTYTRVGMVMFGDEYVFSYMLV